jgi:hypothetical protein
MRLRHPNKHIEAVIQHAESLGWRVESSEGHAWGHLWCPERSREGCRIPVYSTPRVLENHARWIRREVDKCPHGRGAEMETEHEFTLALDGISDLTREAVDALYEAGCDDGTIVMRGGRVSIGFTRSAPTMSEAIVSAIRDVQKATIGARVLRVEGYELDSTQEIDGEVWRLIGA